MSEQSNSESKSRTLSAEDWANYKAYKERRFDEPVDIHLTINGEDCFTLMLSTRAKVKIEGMKVRRNQQLLPFIEDKESNLSDLSGLF